MGLRRGIYATTSNSRGDVRNVKNRTQKVLLRFLSQEYTWPREARACDLVTL